MKLMKRILFLFLAAALILSCAAGHAESVQPVSSVDQDAFLAWLRNYDPEAEIIWEPWRYSASYLKSVEGGSFLASLTEDASHVASVNFDWWNDLNDVSIKNIRELCAAVGDTLSDEALQQIRGAKTPDMGWQETAELEGKELAVSDNGKVSFRGGQYGGSLDLVFSEEASASFTQDALYDLIARTRKDLLYVTLSRSGRTPEGRDYAAEVRLNCEGAVHSIDIMCKLESAEEIAAFFQDGAGLLLSGDDLEKAKAAITGQLPVVMAEEKAYDEHLDSNVSFSLYYNAYDGARMTVYLNVVPAEAAGFINGMKLVRGEHMRPND